MKTLEVSDEKTCVEILIDENKSLLNMKSYNQRTALHEAADSGCLRRVKALLNAEAEVNWTDSFGQTPLHVAAKSGHYLIIEPLLKAGADI